MQTKKIKANSLKGDSHWNYSKHTVVHTAILVATKSWGKLRVNCDFIDSPNILYPITATPAYNKVQIPKLHRLQIELCKTRDIYNYWGFLITTKMRHVNSNYDLLFHGFRLGECLVAGCSTHHCSSPEIMKFFLFSDN